MAWTFDASMYEKLPRIARQQVGLQRLPAALSFQTIAPGTSLRGMAPPYDTLMSWSSVECVQPDLLLPILQDLPACLPAAWGGFFPAGRSALYYSAFGSHLGRYDG